MGGSPSGRRSQARAGVWVGWGIAALLVAGVVPIPAPAAGATAEGAAPVTAQALPPLPGGALHPVEPNRILDTRNGTGGFSAPVGPGQTIAVQVTGQGPVPANGVSGVVLNVTAVNPTVAGFVTIFPTGQTRPLASNLNFVAGQTVPNLVQVALGTGGKVSAFNNAGSVDLVFDVAGWIGPDGEVTTAGLYHPLQPARLLDTRDGTGATGTAPVGGGQTITLQVTGRGGVPAAGVSAVALNLTAVLPTTDTFVTAFPTGSTRPLASNLNPAAGQIVPNRVIVKVSAGGQVSLFNNAGAVHLVVDVGGWYTDDGDPDAIGGRFTGITPVRVLDTRPNNKVGSGATVNPVIAGANGIPPMNGPVPPTAVVANVTVTEPTVAAFLTAHPSQSPRPLASDLNFVPGQTVPNLVIAKLGPDGRLSIFNNAGQSHVVVDVLGWYSGDVVISDKAKILTPAGANALGATAGPDTTTLVFSPIPPELADVAVGDVIVAGLTAKTPAGLLKEVTQVQVTGSTLTLTVVNGSLSDVIVQGDLLGSTPLDATNVAPGGPAVPASVAATDQVDAQASISFNQGLSLTIDKKFGPQDEVKISGSDTFEVGFTLEVNWRCCFEVDAKAEASITNKLALSLTGTADLAVDETRFLGTQRFLPIGFPIGPVVVVVTPQIDLNLKVTAELSGAVSVSATNTNKVVAGIKYENGNFDPYVEDQSDPFEFTGPDITLAGSVKAEIVPDVEALVYGVAGPAFTTAPFVKVTLSSKNLSTCLDLKVEWGLAVRGKFELEVLGKSLGGFSATLKSFTNVALSETVGACGGWVGQMTFNVQNSFSSIDASVVLNADGSYAWSGSVLYWQTATSGPGGPCGAGTFTRFAYVGYKPNGTSVPVETEPVVDAAISDLPPAKWWDSGSNYDPPPPVTGQVHWYDSAFGYPPGFYAIPVRLPVAATYWNGCSWGTALIDLFNGIAGHCPPYPTGVVAEGSTNIVGAFQESYPGATRNVTWDLSWDGTGPPVNGPVPNSCSFS